MKKYFHLPQTEKEKYVMAKLEELVKPWKTWFPPQEYDREKIAYYHQQRDLYLGIKTKFVWTTSPLSLGSSLWSSLWSSLESSLWSSLRSSLWSSLGSSLGSSLWSSLESSLGSSLRASLRPSLWSWLGSSLRSSLWSFYYRFIFWEILCEFDESGKKHNFVKYMTEAQKAGLGFAIITDKEFYALPFPKYFLNSQYQPHRDLAPAIVWADGEKWYFLNGVEMPENIVLKKAEYLKADILLKEKNAEVRREIVRKIGIERICKQLNAKCIDRQKNYELLLLKLEDGRIRPYLKMRNPSIGTYHIEGVHPDCKTVEQALNWRNQTDEKSLIIT